MTRSALGAPWGGAHCSAEDVATFLHSFMHLAGKALREETARPMLRNHTECLGARRGIGFALGPDGLEKGCSERSFGHSRSTGMLVWAEPESDTNCVVVTSLPSSVSGVGSRRRKVGDTNSGAQSRAPCFDSHRFPSKWDKQRDIHPRPQRNPRRRLHSHPMKKRHLFPALLALTLAPSLFAADAKTKPSTYLTAEESRAAGPDFDLQGEFADEGDNAKIGVQVIALGNDTFRAVVHHGGLPGHGWDKSAKIEIEGKRDGEKVEFTLPGGAKAMLTKDTLTGVNEKSTLKKVHRQSPTLGAKPPADAVVLFDGSNVDAWAGGHLDELGRKILASGSKTKRADFQNYTLHVEFLLPFKPIGRGQDRANSGVYMQDRYEVQVLDSFGLKGENNECGGIYSKTKPDVNMCFPPLAWQTYDIDFTAAKFDSDGKKTKNAVITVKHNGVLIHDKTEIAGPTGGGKKEDPSGGAIQLQGHGNPVFYQNVWIVTK
jgi:hypothetical protein